MKIIVAESVGYCYGVERALKLANEARKKSKISIYTLGPVIHNPQAVEDLTAHGIVSIEGLENINNSKESVVVIRSHGVGPNVPAQAKEKKIKIIDATCPFVKKAQRKAAMLVKGEYDVFIIGERNHPEVVGILAHAGNKPIVIENLSDIPNRELNKVGIVVQTTQSVTGLENVISCLLKQVSELRVFNTICDATVKRQMDAGEIAKKVDVMLVVGGRNSANTTRLAEICIAENPNTYLVEIADELEKKNIKDKIIKAKKVGITTGASTPDWQLKKVIKKLNALGSDS